MKIFNSIVICLLLCFASVTLAQAQEECKYPLNSMNITRDTNGGVSPGCVLSISTCDTLVPFTGTKEQVFAEETKNGATIPKQYNLANGSSEVLVLQHEKRPTEWYLFVRNRNNQWVLVQIFKGNAPEPSEFIIFVCELGFSFSRRSCD